MLDLSEGILMCQMMIMINSYRQEGTQKPKMTLEDNEHVGFT